jgi:sugar transport system permease protein
VDIGLQSSASFTNLVRRAVQQRTDHLGLTLALLALVTFYTATAPNFLSISNLTNVLHQISYLGIIACGMTLVIIAGEIDVSVGSAAAFAGVTLALLLKGGVEPVFAVALTVAIGTAIGLTGGFIRAAFLVPSFIVTLGLYGALRGMALLLTEAIPQAPQPIRSAGFDFLGRGNVLGIPVAALVMVVTFAIFWFIAKRTTFGKEVYAIGGNADAAYLAGIPVARNRTILFGITGFLAATSGILLASALGAGDPSTSQGLEFDVIAAVIVGGTSLFGGRGSMVGTALGVLFIGVLGNGLVLLGVNPYAVGVVRGLVILFAVLFTSHGFRERARAVVGGLRLRRHVSAAQVVQEEESPHV